MEVSSVMEQFLHCRINEYVPALTFGRKWKTYSRSFKKDILY